MVTNSGVKINQGGVAKEIKGWINLRKSFKQDVYEGAALSIRPSDVDYMELIGKGASGSVDPIVVAAAEA
eukprot:245033-Pyramimonas_sp.AAC.1